MESLKLMPDYECFPLWDATPGHDGNIDPKTSPISAPRSKRLEDWSDTFDGTSNPDEPLLSGRRDAGQELAFRMEGESLSAALVTELGPAYRVFLALHLQFAGRVASRRREPSIRSIGSEPDSARAGRPGRSARLANPPPPASP